MSIAIITGSAGLVGSEASRHFSSRGLDIVGIDNDMRAVFFGAEASTAWQREKLRQEIATYRHEFADIRDAEAIQRIFRRYQRDISLVIHAAGQPSHEWAALEPVTDFTVNANGTLALLEATRLYAPKAVFIFTSTNKVYGDQPNFLPLIEGPQRWEIHPSHPYRTGIPESLSIDATLHSLFGASKLASDLMVQEYGRYFGMRTVCFRCGCLSGPLHSGTELHGFLAYLMRCAVTGAKYTVFGYKGKQVRDNIHSSDLVQAFDRFFEKPRSGEVYNMGGGCSSNCSLLEAIAACEAITGREMNWEYSPQNRKGDHIWYISDLAKFRAHYPNWSVRYDVRRILEQIFEENRDRWLDPAPVMA